MNYITEETYSHGSRSSVQRTFNIEQFGRDLAKAMGNDVQVTDAGSSYPGVSIICDNGLQITVRHGHGAKLGQVELSGYMPGTHRLPPHDRPKFPSASVNSAGDMARIAKDVIRRVRVPAQAAIDLATSRIEARKISLQALADKCAELRAAYPGISINTKDNELRADVYYNKNGCYLTGDISADGSLSIQRFSVTGPDQARSLFDLIAEVK